MRPELWSWGHGRCSPACEGQSDPEAGRWGFQAARLRPISSWLPGSSGPCPSSIDPCLQLWASCDSQLIFSGQVIMRSCTGINFEEFYHFLKVIAERRLLLLAEGTDSGAMEGGAGSGLGPHQAAFDVSRITEVLASVVAHPDFQKVDTGMFSRSQRSSCSSWRRSWPALSLSSA